MKNLITTVASVILLMAFVVQFVQNQILYFKLIEVEGIIHSYEVVTVDEDLNEENITLLKEKIATLLNCPVEKIVVEDECICFPIKNIVALPEFWGIDSEENYREVSVPLKRKTPKED